MQTIDEFLDGLASGDPVPGGGSAAALQLAMAAALISMVARLTLGRKRFAEQAEHVRSILERSEAIRVAAQQLQRADETAYAAVAAAQKLPRIDEHAAAARRAAIQHALKEAIVPPRDIMHLAAQVVALAQELLPIGNPAASSDVGVAAAAAAAAYTAGHLNVEINLAYIDDPFYIAAARQNLPGQDPSSAAWAVVRHVEASLDRPA